MEPMISAKIAPIMTWETAFPLRCYDSYPFASCSRDRPQAIWELWLKATKPGLKIYFQTFTTDRAEKVRSFFIVR